MAKIGTDIDAAASLLRQGKVVAIPTETVYGLAANALDAEAVTQIFDIKERPSFDPLIVHTSKPETLERYVKPYGAEIAYLIERHTPGPLTIVFQKQDIIPDIVTSGLDTVAIRIPSHPMTCELLDRLDFPLAAPSANPFGYISPTTPEHVDDQLGNKLDYILDGGPCQIGVESTIVSMVEGTLHILRKGGMALEGLAKEFPNMEIHDASSSNPTAPGMLKSHYAPRIPVIICSDLPRMIEHMKDQKIGVLSFDRHYDLSPGSTNTVLSPSGDMLEASRNLFRALRHLDKLDVGTILTAYVPDKGLGRAINDRLKRASVSE